MAEEGEDVKPKLNLIVNYEGVHITVKVKTTMPLKKIFEAAEKRFQKDPGTFKFVFEGNRLNGDDTPAQLGMEDGDMIDAHLQQIGGRGASPIWVLS
ncbi:ubiquitin-related domain-containing protein [Scleroderma citrinum]